MKLTKLLFTANGNPNCMKVYGYFGFCYLSLTSLLVRKP